MTALLLAAWKFLTGPLAGPLFLGAAIAQGVAFGVAEIRLATLHDLIDNPQTGYEHKLAVAQGNAAALQGGLDACNSGVEQLKRAGDEATHAAQTAIDAATRASADYSARISSILRAQASADRCKAADALILGSIP